MEIWWGRFCGPTFFSELALTAHRRSSRSSIVRESPAGHAGRGRTCSRKARSFPLRGDPGPGSLSAWTISEAQKRRIVPSPSRANIINVLRLVESATRPEPDPMTRPGYAHAATLGRNEMITTRTASDAARHARRAHGAVWNPCRVMTGRVEITKRSSSRATTLLQSRNRCVMETFQ